MSAKRRRVVIMGLGEATLVEDESCGSVEIEVSSSDYDVQSILTDLGATWNRKMEPMLPAVMSATPTQPKLEEIPRLVLVELQQNDIVAVIEALKKLYDMLKSENEDSHKHKRDANLTGAPGVIIRAMRRWPKDQVIQVRGCNCLRRLSCENSDGVCAIAQSGGVEAIVDAMNSFCDCPFVQNRAIGVLQNTIAFCTQQLTVSAVTFRFIEEMNGVQVVLRAMKKFPDDADVQADSCALFYNLALFKEEIKELMIRARIVSTVARTLERHLDNEDVREQVDNFLGEMFSKKIQEKPADPPLSLMTGTPVHPDPPISIMMDAHTDPPLSNMSMMT